jgi:hypothetical protein
MKIRSYDDIVAFEHRYRPICGVLIAAVLKDRYIVGSVCKKDGPVCFRESDTFAAAMKGENLAAKFQDSRAVEAWLQWITGFQRGVADPAPASHILVDWNAGVFRQNIDRPRKLWSYGCVADVEHAIYDRPTIVGRRLLQSHPGLGNIAQTEDPRSTDPITDIRIAEPSLASVDSTTRQTLIDARLGQGTFRESLMFVWGGKCAVNKCATKVLLCASHIKPWRDSTNRERLDRYNGLLLSPTMDAAFDRGLISFADTGKILFHPSFSTKDRDLLGLNSSLKLVCVYEENKPYLAHHRQLHGFVT